MKTLSAPVLAALASGSVAIATLIKLDFAGTPVLLNTSTWNLVWQRRYNLLLRSQEFDNASVWGMGSGAGFDPVITPNIIAAPDGTMTADLITWPAGGTQSNSYCLQVPALPPGVYTLSVYCTTSIPILTAGGAVSYTELSFTAIDVGGGWFRQVQVISASSSMTQFLFKRPNNDPGALATYLWGAQLEPGDLVSTYTATTTTALTETGETYLGAYGLGQISAIADKPGEAAGITLELHGADAARISLALDDADIVQGTPCTIRTAIIDTATYTILDAPIEWVGKLDTMAIGEDGTSATIGVTAESAAVDLLRGNAWTFTDADQRIVNAADASFSYVLDQIDKPIVWPTKAFFYK